MTKPKTLTKRYSVKLTKLEENYLNQLVKIIGVSKSEIIRNAIEFMFYNHPAMEVNRILKKQ